MNNDTIALLGDCTAGIEMAVSTMDSLLPGVRDLQLRKTLQESIENHKHLRKQVCNALDRYGGTGKAPSVMTKGMAKLKATARLAMRNDDTTAAYLVADGCDTGIRSLCKSQNRYSMANTEALELSQELIRCEESLSAELRPYL